MLASCRAIDLVNAFAHTIFRSGGDFTTEQETGGRFCTIHAGMGALHVRRAGAVIAHAAVCIELQALFTLVVVANEIACANSEFIVAFFAESLDVYALVVFANEPLFAKPEVIVAVIAASAEGFAPVVFADELAFTESEVVAFFAECAFGFAAPVLAGEIVFANQRAGFIAGIAELADALAFVVFAGERILADVKLVVAAVSELAQLFAGPFDAEIV